MAVFKIESYRPDFAGRVSLKVPSVSENERVPCYCVKGVLDDEPVTWYFPTDTGKTLSALLGPTISILPVSETRVMTFQGVRFEPKNGRYTLTFTAPNNCIHSFISGFDGYEITAPTYSALQEQAHRLIGRMSSQHGRPTTDVIANVAQMQKAIDNILRSGEAGIYLKTVKKHDTDNYVLEYERVIPGDDSLKTASKIVFPKTVTRLDQLIDPRGVFAPCPVHREVRIQGGAYYSPMTLNNLILGCVDEVITLAVGEKFGDDVIILD